MSTSLPPKDLDLSSLAGMLEDYDVNSCCATLYEHPAVRWLLGDELHPGGATTTRCSLELIGAAPADRLLDIASGQGNSSLLAAREFGCTVTGIDCRPAAVIDAARAADAAGVGERAVFYVGDAEALPVEDASFDAVLCECSLSMFANKPKAVAEICRVLRPGGRVAIADVVADHDRLPACLRGPLAAVACVGAALSREDLARELSSRGLRLLATQSCAQEAADMAERVYDRLRGARILGIGRLTGLSQAIEEALEMAVAARAAIARGALDYAIFAGAR